MKATTYLLSLLLLSALLSGCAFSTDKIDLNYTMRGARDKVPDAESVKVSVGLTDKREVRDKVGKKINGFGHEMGAIVSTTDVPGLVREAIQSELAARGFADGGSVVVLCDLNQFYNHFKVGFFAGDSIAQVSFVVQIKSPDGQIVFSKSVVAEGLEPNIQVAAGHNAKASLEKALGKAVADLFEDPAFVPAIFKAAGMNAPPAGK